jgi:putative radical SAM enzyme (TIGR03279 family)
MYYVDDVVKNSLAYRAKIKKGDIITHINDEIVTDGLCYGFLVCQKEIKLTIKNGLDEQRIVHIKNNFEDIGIINNRPLIEDPKSCHNKCLFCFIDQLPKGLRKPLYFKDDDSRLSFLTGNYVTLTNIKDAELDTLIKMRLSPINISVHTTNDDLRIKMLKNKNAGQINEKIKKLIDNNITVNAQIVLVKNYNDKEELSKTIKDLYALGVNSLSVVPVGITKFRENLVELEPFTKEDCKSIIKTIKAFGTSFYKDSFNRFVYPADEFFVKGELELPKYSFYDDFPQIENGVGMLASFIKEFNTALRTKALPENNKKKTVATSVAAYNTIKMLVDKSNAKFDLNIDVIKIVNNFFGENITVAGLLTAKDIITQLKNKDIKNLLLPSAILRSEGDLTLDDMAINDIEKALNCKVTLVENDGRDFLNKMKN